MADNTHRAVRALAGLDNPDDLPPQTRATMKALRPPQAIPLRPGPLGVVQSSPILDTGFYGGQMSKVLNPRTTQTGSWSAPTIAADTGQQGGPWRGAQSLRERWSSNRGGTYTVDPKSMGMEGGIDIGQQIQDSIDHGGYMRGVLDNALQSGKAVPFDTSGWGSRRFDHTSATPDGLTVGRWAGGVQGALTATPDGKWAVNASIRPYKTGSYDLDTKDGSGPLKDLVNAEIGFDRFVSGNGTPFSINFNRTYDFHATGKHGPVAK